MREAGKLAPLGGHAGHERRIEDKGSQHRHAEGEPRQAAIHGAGHYLHRTVRGHDVGDDLVWCRHAAVHDVSSGKSRVTVVPRPSRLAISMRPPWDVTISLA